MEEETQKRNTDCLYFLASPLTCKKGSECEYRHSDNARLNPRDCWYWLNGNCCNPNCAFRHPPLEGLNGVKSDLFYTPSFSAVPTSKSNVPCYFYFNSVCAKGEQCNFLHETFLTQKLLSKPVPESATANHPLENKISTGDIGPASVVLPVNASKEVGPIKMIDHLKEASYSPSVESVVPEFEEPPADNPLPSTEFMDHRSPLSPYLSSEELVKECVDQELDERWESSPGFDVLVDDGSEHAYEDDAEYLQKRESELCHYDFEGSDGFERHSSYPDNGYSFDGLYENYNHTDDIYANYFPPKISELSREKREFDPMCDINGRQRLLRRVHEVHDRDDVVGLQEHFGKHRRMSVRRMPLNFRKRRRSDSHRNSLERPIRRGTNAGSIHSRLTSQVGRCMVNHFSHEGYEPACTYQDRQGWRGNLGTGRFVRSRVRERERERRMRFPRILSEVQQSCGRDNDESARISGAGGFDGPKTLAQIKEEKSRPKSEYVCNSLDHIPRIRRQRQAVVDFEGPKPLEELLRHKRSEGPPQTNTCQNLKHFDNASCKIKNGDDDDDDDDAFRKRLVHIFSQ